MFNASHSFFDLPDFTKENYPMDHPRNAGWEKLPQVLKGYNTSYYFDPLIRSYIGKPFGY